MASRTVWIVGGVVVAIGAIAYLSYNKAPAGKDAAGTIVEAKRARAAGTNSFNPTPTAGTTEQSPRDVAKGTAGLGAAAPARVVAGPGRCAVLGAKTWEWPGRYPRATPHFLRNSPDGCLRQSGQCGDAHANASRWRQPWLGLLTAFVAVGAAFPTRAADLAFVETGELRIVYFDPGEKHLVPHATQSFLSGLATHERLFHYVPDGRVNVLLQDFSDRANATAIPAPRNRIFLDIASSNEPFETLSSAEWFAWTAVHELTHIVDNDRANHSADERVSN